MFSILYIRACGVTETEHYEISIIKITAASQAHFKKLGAPIWLTQGSAAAFQPLRWLSAP